MDILGVYKIDYLNGVIQTKNLISHNNFLNVIEPKKILIEKIDSERRLLSKKKKKDKTLEDYELIKIKRTQIKKLNKELTDQFGSFWFTDKSPLFDAIKSNKLILSQSQGGTHKCKIISTI